MPASNATACCSYFEFPGQPEEDNHPQPITSSVSVVQEAADPVVAAVTPQVVGKLDAELGPHQSWGIVDHYDPPAQGEFFFGEFFNYNGTASCDSTATVMHS